LKERSQNVLKEKESKEEIEHGKIGRRQFLKEAGLIVGGASLGSVAILSACSGNSGTSTVTNTVTKTTTVTAGGAATVTVPGPTITKEVQTTASADLLELTVNGRQYSLTGIKPSYTLAFVLREKCLLPGTKVGCNRGYCGTCAVVVDGRNVYSCLMLAVDSAGKDIQTVEGLSDGINFSNLQKSFIKNKGFQCGFCTPGFLMAGSVLLKKKSNPTMEEVQEAVSGHVCTCGNMTRNVKSVMEGG
jgi:xanthine dehydrogenase YagT iron-sulfur-binding subunit